MHKSTGGTPRILYSCYSHTSREGEQFIPDHVFSYIMAGRQEVFVGDKHYVFNEGDYRFFRRNHLSKYVKYPPAGGGEFKSLSIVIDQQTLHSLSAENDLKIEHPYQGDGAILLQPAPIFQNFVDSLKPYLSGSGEINDIISALKVKEAVMILLKTNPELKNALFDFNEPGKIDLEAYMTANYRFNVDISRFAYLTGRSLATFKRDFERIFHASPGRWLQQMRLKDAYHLINEKGRKVSDVYVDVGFKDLSHFSFAFKKAYGFAPTEGGRQKV